MDYVVRARSCEDTYNALSSRIATTALLPLPFVSCVLLGRFLNLSVLCFLPIQGEDRNTTYLIGIVTRIK